MKEYEIHLSDWGRIFVGDAPAAFYGEIIFRTVYIFILLIICTRILGIRMAAQLSRNDIAAMVSLAAAIGVPVLSQDRGLLPSTLIAIMVVGLTRISAKLNTRNKKIEKITIGDVGTLIEDGVINQKELLKSKIARERVMAQLRAMNIFHLGEVKRLYMESNGNFSLVQEIRPQPGLLTLPSYDTDFVDRVVEFTGETICLQCGSRTEPAAKEAGTCSNCGSKTFTNAVKRKGQPANMN